MAQSHGTCPGGGTAVRITTHLDSGAETVGGLAFVLSRGGSWDGVQVALVGPVSNIARSWFRAVKVLRVTVM